MTPTTHVAHARVAPVAAPGPRGLPLIGVAPRLLGDPLTFLARAAQHHGELVRLDLGRRSMLLVLRPDLLRHILQEHVRNYEKNYGQIAELLGNGIVTSNGAFWLRQRRLMQPAFHHQKIAALADMMVVEASKLAERWEPSARAGRALEIGAEMIDLAQSIILRTMFSTEAGAQSRQIGQAFGAILDFANGRQFNPLQPPLSWPTPANRRFHATLAFLDQTVYGMIDERRRSGDHGNDLLGMLLDAEDAETGERMSPQQLRDEVMTIYLAGHETSATMLTWLLYLLPAHPHVERRVRAELAEVLGGRLPTMADLPRLSYLRMVIDETLRLYPPTWILTRRAVADDELGDLAIPAGTTIAMSPYITHRLSEHWENPEGFDPERFTPERVAGRHKLAYFPFLSGPRLCIGSSFALTEIQLVLATLLQRFQLESIPGYPVSPVAKALLKPGPAVWMRLAPA